MTPEQLSDKTKLLRAGRMVLFIVILGGLSGWISTLIPAHWGETMKSDLRYVAALAAGMTTVVMLLTYWSPHFLPFTGKWKDQLIGLITFFLTISTARMIGYLLAMLIAPNTENAGIAFLFFLAGVIILAPFQFIAYRAYAKRRGIPTGRICRSDSPRT